MNIKYFWPKTTIKPFFYKHLKILIAIAKPGLNPLLLCGKSKVFPIHLTMLFHAKNISLEFFHHIPAEPFAFASHKTCYRGKQ